MPSDRDLCNVVCRTAARLGYKLVQLKSQVGWSYSFVDAHHRQAASGSISKDREAALVSACKELMPLISESL